jgi:hypothetical protein
MKGEVNGKRDLSPMIGLSKKDGKKSPRGNRRRK